MNVNDDMFLPHFYFYFLYLPEFLFHLVLAKQIHL